MHCQWIKTSFHYLWIKASLPYLWIKTFYIAYALRHLYLYNLWINTSIHYLWINTIFVFRLTITTGSLLNRKWAMSILGDSIKFNFSVVILSIILNCLIPGMVSALPWYSMHNTSQSQWVPDKQAKYAETSENVPSDMCAQSDQNLHWAHFE